MYCATLIFCSRKYISNGFRHTKALITNDLPDSCKAPLFKPDKEVMPAFKIFLHAFCGADDLAIAVCRYADSNKDGHILYFAAPAAFQVNTVNINVCVFTGLFSAVPGFDMLVSLLVEVTDRSWRYLSPPKGFCDILHAADGYTGQIHFDQGFFDGAFPAFIAFDDGCLKLDAFQFRDL